jgi:hypothetical protein
VYGKPTNVKIWSIIDLLQMTLLMMEEYIIGCSSLAKTQKASIGPPTTMHIVGQGYFRHKNVDTNKTMLGAIV